VLSGRGLCEELITRPEEFYRLCCVAVCDLETSRIGAPYIYDISHLRVNVHWLDIIDEVKNVNVYTQFDFQLLHNGYFLCTYLFRLSAVTIIRNT
jgi:hypothetical protein